MMQRPAQPSVPASAGFTLIELLVVIGIIGMLAVAFLPQIVQGQQAANIAVDQANLKRQYSWIQEYKRRFKRIPDGGGHMFLILPWQRGCVDKTPENFQRYFVPSDAPVWQGIMESAGGIDQVWGTGSSPDSTQTDYAGLRKEKRPRSVTTGKIALAATDNELGQLLQTGSVNVLLGDGVVRELNLDHFEEYGWTAEDLSSQARPFPVGEDSPMELLQFLRY